MSAIISAYISVAKLKEILETVEGKNEKGFAFTCTLNDEANQYGQNVACFAEQSKEQREAKAPRYYFANGKVVWTSGSVTVAPKKEKDAVASPVAAPATEETPF